MTRSKPPNRESVSSPEISGAPRTPENVSETKPVSLHDQITQTTLTLKKKIKQLKATRKLVNASSAQYILQRESLGLPPDPSTPPGVQESQNRVEKLSTQERELAQENHLLEIEATIGMLSSDRVKDKVVKIKSETQTLVRKLVID